MEEETSLDPGLPSLHFALVVTVVAHVISHAPVLAREGIEVDRIVGTVLVVWEDVGAPDAKHVESYCTYIAEEGDVGGGKDGVFGIGAIKPSGYETDTQFGVCAIVWATDDAEVELLVVLVFIGIIEVVEKASD